MSITVQTLEIVAILINTLVAFHVRGDGNCLFRAISYFVHGTVEEHANVREAVVQYIVDNWSDFEETLEPFAEDAATYREKMLHIPKDGTHPEYGDHAEIIAAERLFGRRILVWTQANSSSAFVPSHGFFQLYHPNDPNPPPPVDPADLATIPADAILLARTESPARR
jgi:hypothetical protein